MFIPIRIPDPGVKKASDPGSATLQAMNDAREGGTHSLRSHCFSWLLSRGMKNRMKKGAALISSVAPIACQNTKKIKI
jgi:hypothetical protein